ncbi:hypothetical protein EG328_004019 [Venturia inaequalis]|uniref:Uncharacterized protein n=1 Tax=Venturia inaequalis TaxID=5025 RepID=A0A8H3UNE6_VENIN|nr:hypothetical protein EG328_004019 [Venturia inaequalis]
MKGSGSFKVVKKDRGRGRQKATSSRHRDVYDVPDSDSDDDDDEDEDEDEDDDDDDETSAPALRRPETAGVWYSKTDAEWKDLTVATQRKYHHLGRIEEVVGTVAVAPSSDQAGYACSRCRKDGFTCRNAAAGAAFGVPRKSLNERNKELVKENAALKAENTLLAAAAKKWKRKLFELKALYEAEEDDDGEEFV